MKKKKNWIKYKLNMNAYFVSSVTQIYEILSHNP